MRSLAWLVVSQIGWLFIITASALFVVPYVRKGADWHDARKPPEFSPGAEGERQRRRAARFRKVGVVLDAVGLVILAVSYLFGQRR